MANLSNKSALVTGGSRGIGAAIAIATQAALKHLHDGGRIITIGSCVGAPPSQPNENVFRSL